VTPTTLLHALRYQTPFRLLPPLLNRPEGERSPAPLAPLSRTVQRTIGQHVVPSASKEREGASVCCLSRTVEPQRPTRTPIVRYCSIAYRYPRAAVGCPRCGLAGRNTTDIATQVSLERKASAKPISSCTTALSLPRRVGSRCQSGDVVATIASDWGHGAISLVRHHVAIILRAGQRASVERVLSSALAARG
jgi:hypothetical protein